MENTCTMIRWPGRKTWFAVGNVIRYSSGLQNSRTVSSAATEQPANITIGPPTHDFDFAMVKRFPLGKEERYLQFRSKFFNGFNHPNFDTPV
jgi:hypothetical protein